MLEAIRTFFLPSEVNVAVYVFFFIVVVIAYFFILWGVAVWRSGATSRPLASTPSPVKKEEKEEEMNLNLVSRMTAGVFFLLLVALGCFLLQIFFTEGSHRWNADRITATITDVVYTDDHRNDSALVRFVRRNYYLNVSYSYEVGGSRYTGVEHICYDTSRHKGANSRCEYFLPRVRDTHEIYVSRSDPKKSYFPKGFLSEGFWGVILLGVAYAISSFIRRACFPKKNA